MAKTLTFQPQAEPPETLDEGSERLWATITVKNHLNERTTISLDADLWLRMAHLHGSLKAGNAAIAALAKEGPAPTGLNLSATVSEKVRRELRRRGR